MRNTRKTILDDEISVDEEEDNGII